MSNIHFIISNKKNSLLIEFDYAIIEDNVIYAFDIEPKDSKIRFSKNETYIFSGFIKNIKNELEILFEYEFTLLNDIHLEEGNNYIVLRGNIIDNEIEYHKYDQLLVDLLYNWNRENYIINFQKKVWLYTFATLLYSGIPDYLPNDKKIVIDGKLIYTPYEFFNLFAEGLLGKKRYLANNLDSLGDTLKNANRTSGNVVQIDNELDLKKNLYFSTGDYDYLDKILKILKMYNFKVILLR